MPNYTLPLDTILVNTVWQFYILFFNSVYSSSQLCRAVDSVSKCSPDMNNSPLLACPLNFQKLFLNYINVTRATLLLTTISNQCLFSIFNSPLQNKGPKHSRSRSSIHGCTAGAGSGHGTQDTCSGYVRAQGTALRARSHNLRLLKSFFLNCCTKSKFIAQRQLVSASNRPKNRLCQRQMFKSWWLNVALESSHKVSNLHSLPPCSPGPRGPQSYQ